MLGRYTHPVDLNSTEEFAFVSVPESVALPLLERSDVHLANTNRGGGEAAMVLLTVLGTSADLVSLAVARDYLSARLREVLSMLRGDRSGERRELEIKLGDDFELRWRLPSDSDRTEEQIVAFLQSVLTADSDAATEERPESR